MTDVRLYSWTHEAWQAMYEDCRNAAISIEFEQYIVRDDEIGRKFLALFAEKAKQGIRVRLLLDRLGARQVYNSPLVEEIRENGGHVIFYNAIGWLNIFLPHTWFPRNHAKALLIDSTIAYTGGVCLADYMSNWRDLHARLTGDPARAVEEDFSFIWGRMTGRKKLQKKVARGNGFNYVVTYPSFSVHPIYEELLGEISRAQENIYLATPYFVPPGRLLRALQAAAARGVDVRIIVTHETDVPLAVHVSHSYFPSFIKKGIRIFSYRKTVFHAKYAVIDGRWAMLGSTNMDYLSLLRNREANLMIRDINTIEELNQQFLENLTDCREFKADFWKSVPLHLRIFGHTGRCLKKMI